MAKFNVTVELDWLNENEDIDSEIKDAVVKQIAKDIVNKNLADISVKCKEAVEKSTCEKLNVYMEEFFTTPHDITDKYGDVVEKDVTVKSILKKQCEEFVSQPLDRNGNPDNSYRPAYKNRTEYIVQKCMKEEFDRVIKNTIDEIVTELKKTIAESVKGKIGSKMAEILELDSMFK